MYTLWLVPMDADAGYLISCTLFMLLAIFFFLVLSLLSTGSQHAGVQGSVCLGFCHSGEALSVDLSESTSGSLIELRPLR